MSRGSEGPSDRARADAAEQRLDACRSLVKRWREYADVAEDKRRADHWIRCANALEEALRP